MVKTKSEKLTKAEKAAQLSYKLVNVEGKEVGSVELDSNVFGLQPEQNLVHEVVRWQMAKRRAGTHYTQTRGDMKSGGRKPYKQKSTGMARAGSNASPVWVGGGVAHGPKPRDYEFRLSKRVRSQALCSVLSSKVSDNSLVVLDSLSPKTTKTSEVAKILSKLGVAARAKKGQAVLLTMDSSGSVTRAARNIAGTLTLPLSGVNVYDLLRHKYLIGTKDVIAELQKTLQGRQGA